MLSSLGFISRQTRVDLTHVVERAIVQAHTEELNEKRRKMLDDAAMAKNSSQSAPRMTSAKFWGGWVAVEFYATLSGQSSSVG